MSLITRRKLLSMASSSFVALPLLRVFREQQALAAEHKKVLFVYFPTGCYPGTFFPETGTLDTLPVVSAPLVEHKKDLIFVQGLCHKGETSHAGGPKQVFSGIPTSNGVAHSLDQMLAESTMGQGVFRASIALGLATTDSGAGLSQAVLYKSGQPMPAVDDPKASYADIFGTVAALPKGGSNAVADANKDIAKGKKRVIDFVRADLKRIEAALGPVEKTRFQAHVAALDDLYKDIQRTEANAEVVKCFGPRFEAMLPSDPDPKWFHKPLLNPTVNKFNRELMIQSLACNATRIGVMQYSYSEAEMNFQFEGRPFNGQHYHGNSHARNDLYLADQASFMGEIAKMIAQLKAAGLWESTLLVAVTCLGNPGDHTGNNIACFMGSGMLKGNRVVSYPCDESKLTGLPNSNKAYNHFLVTAAHLVGQPQINYIGNLEFAGPLKELTD